MSFSFTKYIFILHSSIFTICYCVNIEFSDVFCVRNELEFYELAPADNGDRVQLECGLCGNKVVALEPHVWYYKNVKDVGEWSELVLGMLAPYTDNRVYVEPMHSSLVIQQFRSTEDAGFYQCRDFRGVQQAVYLVDGAVTPSGSIGRLVQTGDKAEWLKFKEEMLFPLGRVLDKIAGDDTPEVAPLWSSWGPCGSCGYAGMGQRYRLARCHVVAPASLGLLPHNLTSLSCGSRLMTLNKNVTEILRAVPDFLFYETCECTDNTTVTEVNVTQKLQHELNEGDSLNLTCPGSSLNNAITWKRGLEEINPGLWIRLGRTARIRVDTQNILRIERAEIAVAGYFSCKVAGRLWRFLVTVKAASVLATEEFHRHLNYLLLVIGFCFALYLIYLTMVFCQRPDVRRELISHKKYRRLDRVS